MSGSDWEALRRKFLPTRVRVLFIGESPPVSGRFFYSGNSGLYRAIRDVFRAADPSIDDEIFLLRFREWGCYMIDTCGDPVDHLERKARREACAAREPLLSKRIKRLQPELIVSLMRSIWRNVERAAAGAGWEGTLLDVPYPGRWIDHRKIFAAKLLPYVRALLANKDFG